MLRCLVSAKCSIGLSAGPGSATRKCPHRSRVSRPERRAARLYPKPLRPASAICERHYPSFGRVARITPQTPAAKPRRKKIMRNAGLVCSKRSSPQPTAVPTTTAPMNSLTDFVAIDHAAPAEPSPGTSGACATGLRRTDLRSPASLSSRAFSAFSSSPSAAMLAPSTSAWLDRSGGVWQGQAGIYGAGHEQVAGARTFIALICQMMLRGGELTEHAAQEDEKPAALLTITVVAAIMALAAIVWELGPVKDMKGAAKALHLSLVGLTILSSWAFIHMMFALHYAAQFYATAGDDVRGGFLFPDCETPGWAEFCYESFTIGCACATADVNLTTRGARVICLIQGIIAFFFNTIILALTINIGAGLFR